MLERAQQPVLDGLSSFGNKELAQETVVAFEQQDLGASGSRLIQSEQISA